MAIDVFDKTLSGWTKSAASLLLGLVSVFAAEPSAAQGYGTDSRAFNFINGFLKEGGYKVDSNEFINNANGIEKSSISGRFTGTFTSYCRTQNDCDYNDVVAPYTASADLATGKMRAYAASYYVPVGNSYTLGQAGSNASMLDTLTFSFDPAVGPYTTLGFRTKVSGDFQPGGPGAAGSVTTLLSASGTFSGTPYTYGGTYVSGFGSPVFSGGNLTSYGNGVYGFDLRVATTSPVTLKMIAGLSVRAYGAVMDYSHTAALGLVMDNGVSFSSASGLLLSQIDTAVPEPATWMSMILGFGMIGAAARYRRRNTQTAYI